ncbi:hypothetical protein GTY80_08745 [Amycolatopsis sp. SID8362]|nr:hypothetical protein [Amycolatopsis sp. SID8362]NED40042.1 hypothetical protein [Amycolatopsis sp. SID8362]
MTVGGSPCPSGRNGTAERRQRIRCTGRQGASGLAERRFDLGDQCRYHAGIVDERGRHTEQAHPVEKVEQDLSNRGHHRSFSDHQFLTSACPP